MMHCTKMSITNFLFIVIVILSLFKVSLSDGTAVTVTNEHDADAVVQTQSNAFVTVDVETEKTVYKIDHKFVSVTIDSGQIRYNFPGNRGQSKKFQNLAKALAPNDVRIGGTNADFLTFDPEGVESRDVSKQSIVDSITNYKHSEAKDLKNFTMTGKQWHQMSTFFSSVGWDVMFDFNLFRWKDGLWDPSNADKLLRYSALRGYPLHAFQLGNEPNSFHHNFNFTIPAATLVKDFNTLRSILMKYPSYFRKKVYGPDVTDLRKHSSSRDYLVDFVSARGNLYVDEISLHQYYLNGRLAKVSDFYDVSVLDRLKSEIEYGHQLSGGAKIRFTETSSCFGGGAPGLSDRYVAGFLWLDKLGLSAKLGVTSVFRQSFFGGSYALVSDDNHPNPDYFLTKLFKQLIEGNVFNATVQPYTKYLRVYAHCTKESVMYKKGALTFAFLNTKNTSTTVSFGQFSSEPIHLYLLTPGDSLGLKSRFVKLNRNVLKMSGDSVPMLKPRVWKGDVKVSALSFGFVVVPHANATLCMKK